MELMENPFMYYFYLITFISISLYRYSLYRLQCKTIIQTTK